MTRIELPGKLAGVKGAAPLGGSGAAPRRGRGAAPPKQNAKMHSKLPIRSCYIFLVFPVLACPLERGIGRSSVDWKLSASLQSPVKILECVILRSRGCSYARAHLSLFARSFWSSSLERAVLSSSGDRGTDSINSRVGSDFRRTAPDLLFGF